MIYPMQRALEAFLIIFSWLPEPFILYITWTIVITILLRVILLVVGS